jgi:hypothetical protein
MIVTTMIWQMQCQHEEVARLLQQQQQQQTAVGQKEGGVMTRDPSSSSSSSSSSRRRRSRRMLTGRWCLQGDPLWSDNSSYGSERSGGNRSGRQLAQASESDDAALLPQC